MTALDISILIYSYAFSGLLIYLIDHGLERRFQLMGCGIACSIFICYYLFSKKTEFSGLNYGFLSLPIVALFIFNLAGLISWKINAREFRASWRGARYFYTAKKNGMDYFLSFAIVMTEIGWPLLIGVILKKL